MKKTILLLVCMVFNIQFNYAQAPTYSWGKINHSFVDDAGKGVAVDNQGNVIETGTTRVLLGNYFNLQGQFIAQSPPAIEHGSHAVSGYPWSDSYIAKYSPSGTLLWYLKTTGGYFESIESVDTDSQNNIILVISTRSYDAMLGSIPLPHPVGQFPNRTKGFVIKLNPNGQHIWTKPIDVNLGTYPLNIGPNGITMRQVKVDHLDNIYCLGSFFGETMFIDNFSVTGSGVFNTNQYDHDYFMLKLNPAGNVSWLTGLKSYGIKGYSKFNINENNVIAIAGNSNAATVNIGNFVFNNPINLEQQPSFLAKIDANTGNGTWATTLSTYSGINIGGDFYISLIARESLIDNQGNIYICGGFSGLYETYQHFNLTFGSSTINAPFIVAQDNSQNFRRDSFMFLAKFDSQGNRAWLKTSDDLYNYVISLGDIEFDSQNNIIGLGNYLQPTIIANNILLPNSYCGAETTGCNQAGAFKSFLVKFDTSTNNFTWSRQVGDTFRMSPVNMELSNSNEIVIGGSIIQDNINFDGNIVNGYPIAGGFTDAFIAKFNNSSLSINEDNSVANIDVFPNPTSGELYFSGDIENIKRIELYDYTGKMIKSENNNNINQIDISHLPIGLYLVKIIDNYNNISTKKIIKK
jgi:Secretion system C-terminal sorting domain